MTAFLAHTAPNALSSRRISNLLIALDDQLIHPLIKNSFDYVSPPKTKRPEKSANKTDLKITSLKFTQSVNTQCHKKSYSMTQKPKGINQVGRNVPKKGVNFASKTIIQQPSKKKDHSLDKKKCDSSNKPSHSRVKSIYINPINITTSKNNLVISKQYKVQAKILRLQKSLKKPQKISIANKMQYSTSKQINDVNKKIIPSHKSSASEIVKTFRDTKKSNEYTEDMKKKEDLKRKRSVGCTEKSGRENSKKKKTPNIKYQINLKRTSESLRQKNINAQPRVHTEKNTAGNKKVIIRNIDLTKCKAKQAGIPLKFNAINNSNTCRVRDTSYKRERSNDNRNSMNLRDENIMKTFHKTIIEMVSSNLCAQPSDLLYNKNDSPSFQDESTHDHAKPLPPSKIKIKKKNNVFL